MRHLILMGALGLSVSACSQVPPTDAVPCLVLTPRTDALKAGLIANPGTADAVGNPAADLILGTERVCG